MREDEPKDSTPFSKVHSTPEGGRQIVPLKKVPGLKSLNLELSWRFVLIQRHTSGGMVRS